MHSDVYVCNILKYNFKKPEVSLRRVHHVDASWTHENRAGHVIF